MLVTNSCIWIRDPAPHFSQEVPQATLTPSREGNTKHKSTLDTWWVVQNWPVLVDWRGSFTGKPWKLMDLKLWSSLLWQPSARQYSIYNSQSHVCRPPPPSLLRGRNPCIILITVWQLRKSNSFCLWLQRFKILFIHENDLLKGGL